MHEHFAANDSNTIKIDFIHLIVCASADVPIVDESAADVVSSLDRILGRKMLICFSVPVQCIASLLEHPGC